jgi:hypothetical protein
MAGKIQGAFGWYLERDAVQDGEPVKEYYRDGFMGQWTTKFDQRGKFDSFDEALVVYNRFDEPTERASSARICANERM